MSFYIRLLPAISFIFLITSVIHGQTDQTTRSGSEKYLKETVLTKTKAPEKKVGFNITSTVLFSEDFDNIPGSTAGGPGTYVFPSGWLLVNQDNRTPAAGVAYVNEAWARREDFNFNVGDSVAFSTSWYEPTGQADDWMISPAILVTTDAELTWNAVTYDPAYRDGYEVRISTTTQSVAGCMANPPLFSVAQENSAWTMRSVDLTAFANQTVYIAWRNNSNDKFLLAIDDIIVRQIPQIDGEIMAYNPSEYNSVPLLLNILLALKADVKNLGSDTLKGVSVTADVLQSGNIIYSSEVPVSSIPPSSTLEVTFDSFIPSDTGMVEIYYELNVPGDLNTSNNIGAVQTHVSFDMLQRDNGIVTGTLGIGAGSGEVGSNYSIPGKALVKGVNFLLVLPYTNVPVFAYLREFTNGKPGALVAVSDTFYSQTNESQFINLDFQGGPFEVTDNFAITIVEVDSVLTVGTADGNYIPGTNWANWPTSPYGDWANIEQFGFQKTFMIRPVFQLPGTMVNVDGDLSEDGYKILGTKLNSNSGFGSSINIKTLKAAVDTTAEMLYIGVEGVLGNADGIGLWLGFQETQGLPAGSSLGGFPGSHYMGDTLHKQYTADFEVDYMFAFYPHSNLPQVNAAVVRLTGSRDAQDIGSSGKSGELKIGPADSMVFPVNSLRFAFDSSGTEDRGLEIGIPMKELGVTGESEIQAFAFLVSNTAYFSDVTIPGNVSTGNPGFDADFMNMAGGPWHTSSKLTSVDYTYNALPEEFSLQQNYPNPFNPETIIRYALKTEANVVIKVYDILGTEIARLVNEKKPAGDYQVLFNASKLSSGVYFYSIQAGDFSAVRKMILMK